MPTEGLTGAVNLDGDDGDRRPREAASKAKEGIKAILKPKAKPRKEQVVKTDNDAQDNLNGGELSDDEYVDADNENMAADYDVADEADLKDAATEARSIKVSFDRKDVKSWLQRFEIRLEFAGVRSQWLKRLCLENILPEDVANTCKEYFIQPKSTADKDIYKKCKTRILEVYGPKPEEDFFKAVNFVMTGLPSDAAKEIRDLVCEKQKPLESCCCAKQVGAVWRKLLPPTVRASVAAMDLKTNFDATIKHADHVFNSLKVAQPVALVTPRKPPTASARPADLDTSADAPALDPMAALTSEIAALRKDFKSAKKPKGVANSGQGAQKGRGAAGKPQSRGRGKPHPDGPPENACLIHWKHGRGAFYCLEPDTCDWATVIATP